MLQALQKIELLSPSLSDQAMIIAGAVLAITGLCTWLGGLRWHLLSAILAGIFAGLVCSSFTDTQYQVQAFGIAAAAVALLTAALRKRSLVFTASLIVVYSGLFISVLPAMNQTTEYSMPNWPQLSQANTQYSPSDSLVIIADHTFFLTGFVGSHIKNAPGIALTFLATIGVIILGGGLFFARILSALAAAMLGTFFVFTGMIILLLQKGALPFTALDKKTVFFQTILICMIIFGVACNFLLCPIRRTKPVDKDNKKKKKEKRNDFI